MASSLAEEPAAQPDKACLILSGDKDAMFKEGRHARWAQELPDRAMETLPRVMHLPFEDAPEATVAAFTHWCEGRVGSDGRGRV